MEDQVLHLNLTWINSYNHDFEDLCFCDDLIGLELPSDVPTVITSGTRTEKHWPLISVWKSRCVLEIIIVFSTCPMCFTSPNQWFLYSAGDVCETSSQSCYKSTVSQLLDVVFSHHLGAIVSYVEGLILLVLWVQGSVFLWWAHWFGITVWRFYGDYISWHQSWETLAPKSCWRRFICVSPPLINNFCIVQVMFMRILKSRHRAVKNPR